MATFFGQVKGNRGVATRCSTRNKGITVSAQSYNGSVITELNYKEDGKLLVKLGVVYNDSNDRWDELLFCGTIEELKEKLNRA